MHRLFRWLSQPRQVDPSEDALAQARRIADVLHDLNRKVDQQRDDYEALKLKFESFQGRVYAWRRGGQQAFPEETPEKPAELPLSDPRVTKEELRARLVKPGKPFNHSNERQE